MRYSNFIFKSIFALALATLLIGCGSQAEQDNTPEGKRKQLTEKQKQLAALQAEITALEAEVGLLNTTKKIRPIEVLPLANDTFKHFIEVQGQVESDKNILVTPEMQGVITNLLVKEGDRVSAGQTLATLDAESVSRNISELRTRLELATTTYEKRKTLWDQNIGSEIEYLQAKNQKESLEKNIEVLNNQLSKGKVIAPISGIIEEVIARKGEMANPAMPMMRLVNIEQVKVTADVSERYLGKIKIGDIVEVILPSLDMNRKEKVSFIGQTVNPDNRTFKVQVMLSNSDGNFKPNAIARVRINDFSKENAVSVPTHLIQRGTDGNSFVYIAEKQGENYIVKKVIITTGKSYEGKTLVEEGLSGSEMLVFKGYNEVTDGEEVSVVAGQPNTQEKQVAEK
ncbi:MAG: efflux RND transporter periplasmic adaptor subunit [Bernardetiaceae bacterium]|nr:efflux RND transporter periplasmic adaptor subunit [Bernardetiaceae bacterium]